MPLNKDKGLSETIKACLKEREEKGSPSISALLEMLLDTLVKGKWSKVNGRIKAHS